LTTIFVQGIGTNISDPVMATTVPLPTKLGGISVFLKQTEAPQGPIPVPLLAVFPVNACRSPMFEPCGSLLGINLQIPFELAPNPANTISAFPINYAQLVVSEEGGGHATVEAMPLVDRIHILRVGDTLTNPGAANIDRQLPVLEALVTHSDGTPVSPLRGGRPAQPGETLVLYAVGVGRVTPSVKTGEVTPVPAPVAYLSITFDYNSRGEVSPHNPINFGGNPIFSGLTPGFVGLYQVNFVVPDPPPNYRVACGTQLGFTNFTVSIGRVTSFDGAKICVQFTVSSSTPQKSGR
jgi:uncharacterized protein (TIGR03437 family)